MQRLVSLPSLDQSNLNRDELSTIERINFEDFRNAIIKLSQKIKSNQAFQKDFPDFKLEEFAIECIELGTKLKTPTRQRRHGSHIIEEAGERQIYLGKVILDPKSKLDSQKALTDFLTNLGDDLINSLEDSEELRVIRMIFELLKDELIARKVHGAVSLQLSYAEKQQLHKFPV